ncbi:ABC transporter substrate-binding protein [Lacinutrix sp. C3R15]|uniref:ABC transporter substrate-binding protein n=1 Tax=Flavobacteriaceae TaxID=49546 RepID=UPI001C09D41C|nr:MULTISPECIES: ABC transporter substrate-binding protein [Flavobacteriaceae]MBU2938870.1 ABC transporter substrate-binding protein [Lacinutrix sp. C3R15]MDO6622183.1 ABC transporter substrate-binding protein [Oceanihabitans sp. 1_MG-2023]
MLQNKTFTSLLFCSILLFISCKKEVKTIPETSKQDVAKSENKYAEGFSITHTENFKILTIKNPWPKAEKEYKYALVPKNAASKITLNKDAFDGIITIPIENIVVTSTTHIPALELLNVEETLIGFPGTDYVSSEKTRTRIDNQEIRELGKNEGINTEVLLELQPDVVIGFGIDGNNKTFETIKKANIPVIYNGDWVEKSPLAKAEWIKFFGVLYNKGKEAEVVFNQIEKDYLEAKTIASTVEKQPTVLSGAMHKDIWYLPNGTSPEAQILKDANVNYLWSETTGNGSLSLNFETVFEKAEHADLWLSPSYYNSIEALEKANQHYAKFDAFKNKNMYTFANTTGKTGGVLYYELGTARPDLVLKDVIKICHPGVLQNYTPYFFKPLE